MAFRHGFDGVADEFTAGQRVFHAFVSHGDAVADADSGKFYRCTAYQDDASLDCLCHAVQEQMPRDQFILRVDDTDERTVDFFFYISHSVEEGTYRGSAGPLFYLVTVHNIYLSFPVVY